MSLTIKAVNYSDPIQGQAFLYLMNHYASGAAGGGQPLSEEVMENLVARLNQIPTAFSFIAAVDQKAVGLVNCFEAFSTFAARPLINVHDLMVHSDFRGQGISQLLLAAVEQEAIARHCCKITLEVLAGNGAARRAYEKFGFQGYQLDPSMGQAIFLEKSL